jgi:hypothetical protein
MEGNDEFHFFRLTGEVKERRHPSLRSDDRRLSRRILESEAKEESLSRSTFTHRAVWALMRLSREKKADQKRRSQKEGPRV